MIHFIAFSFLLNKKISSTNRRFFRQFYSSFHIYRHFYVVIIAIVMPFLREFAIVGAVVIIIYLFFFFIIVMSRWCISFTIIRQATIICKIAHQIATIQLLLNDDRFVCLLPFLWVWHVGILSFFSSSLFLTPTFLAAISFP